MGLGLILGSEQGRPTRIHQLEPGWKLVRGCELGRSARWRWFEVGQRLVRGFELGHRGIGLRLDRDWCGALSWGGRREGVGLYAWAPRVWDFFQDLNSSFAEMTVGVDLIGEARAESAHDFAGWCLDGHADGLACAHLFQFDLEGGVDAGVCRGGNGAISVKRETLRQRG